MARTTKTIEQQAKEAQLKLQIIKDKNEARYLQYINKNLEISRKRKTGWTSPAPAERDFTNSDRLKTIAQARQLVDENPFAQSLLHSHLDYVIGTEFKLNMRTGNNDWDNKVEQWWNLKKDQLDIRNYKTWGKLLRCWQARRMVDGDVGIAFIEDTFNGFDKAWVQTIEADRIFKHDPYDINDSGIDFDAHGMPLTYFVGKRDRKAGDVSQQFDRRYFHLFTYQPNERAEMLRGQSAFLVLINLLKDLDETMEAVALKIKKESFMGLKFKTVGGQNPFQQVFKGDESGFTRPHVNLVSGLNLNLDVNEEAEIMESKTPNSEYQSYIKQQMRIAGLPFGLPLEYILFDSSDVNYSGLMALASMLKRIIKVHQSDVRSTASRVFQWVLSYEGLQTLGNPPQDIKNTYWEHTWGAGNSGFIDPAKEASAFTALLDAGLTTKQIILAEIGNGEDIEDIVNQRAKEKALEQSAGLTGMAPVPNAVGQ